MGKLHLSFEELSALFDGELPAPAEATARQHLRECPRCSAEYSLSVRLDRDLRQPPVLSCETVLEVLSARFDGQANEAERAAGERHLASCESCGARLQNWARTADLLRTLPAGRPSARVDAAIVRLVAPPRSVRVGRLPGLPARLAIAGAAIVAIVISGVQPAQAPVATPQVEDGSGVIVAAAQQIVYNEKNNTLYVLDTATAAVNAREPETNALKARIQIGGEPIRLTLNEATNTILVLDAAQKRVTEIDAATNTVAVAYALPAAPGTPTSINVDTTGKIVVSSVPDPRASAAPGGGTVAVIDSATKQLEVLREVDVAPRIVIVDPLSNQAALVSIEATKLVDSSYKVLATLPGGVAAAFSRKGDGLAVLSAAGANTTITFAGSFAPQALTLQGSPSAIKALKEGGYLVLLQIDGQSRVVKVSADGRAVGSTSVAVAGTDLAYDEATNFFSVAGAGTIASAQAPGAETAVAKSASPTAAPTTQPSPAPSATPVASSSPAPTDPDRAIASPQPSVAVAVPRNVLAAAKSVGPSLYSASLPANLKPHLVAGTGSKLWFVDQASRVGWFDMVTGEVRTLAKLRQDAHVGYWVAGRSFVFGVDADNGQVHVVNTVIEAVDSFATNVLSPVSAVVVGHDDKLWLALRNTSYLLAWDPRTRGMDAFDLGDRQVTALAIDARGRVVYADDAHALVGTLDPVTSRLSEVQLVRQGTTTALVVDGTGTLWLGTSAGNIYALGSSGPRLGLNVRMPVTSLALDRSGRAWFLAPLTGGIGGFAYGPADGSQAVRTFTGPAIGLVFGEGGFTFAADPRGAVYIATEDGR